MTTLLFKTDNFEVLSTTKKSHFIIHFKYKEIKLINSLIKTRLIPGSSTDENYKTITFKADNVKTLKQFLDASYLKHGKKGLLVPDIAKMVRTLSRQLYYLIENEHISPIGYNPEDIIVINDDKFLFLGSEWLSNINETN